MLLNKVLSTRRTAARRRGDHDSGQRVVDGQFDTWWTLSDGRGTVNDASVGGPIYAERVTDGRVVLEKEEDGVTRTVEQGGGR